MPLASSSSVAVRAIKEAIFGVTPNTGNPLNLRVTGETLSFDITKESSKEINATRTVSSVVPVTAKSSGGLTMEMTYDSVEPFLESTLQNTFAEFGTNGVGAATATTSVSATLITASILAICCQRFGISSRLYPWASPHMQTSLNGIGSGPPKLWCLDPARSFHIL